MVIVLQECKMCIIWDHGKRHDQHTNTALYECLCTKLTIKWGKCNAKQYIGNNNEDYSQNRKKTNSSSAKMEQKPTKLEFISQIGRAHV